jgi:hypothetical protein
MAETDVIPQPKRSLIYVYLAALAVLFDASMTAVGVLKYHGTEADPIFNWIKNPVYMVASMYIDDILFIIGVIVVYCFFVNRGKFKLLDSLDKLLIIGSVWRIFCGLTWLLPPA